MKRSGAIVLMMMTALIVRAEEPDFPLQAGFVLEGDPLVGVEFDLNFVAKAMNDDVPAFRLSIVIPAGIEALSDTASFVVDPQQGDSASRSFTMKTLKEGAYHIRATLSFTEPEFEPLTEYYIVSGHDTALHSNEPFEGWVYRKRGTQYYFSRPLSRPAATAHVYLSRTGNAFEERSARTQAESRGTACRVPARAVRLRATLTRRPGGGDKA